MKWMWQKPSEASVPPVMGEFWQDNHHPVFRENAHLASEPSLTSHKAISLTLSHSSSWKSWKDKCLLCSFSVEETKEERDEASCSKSPGFTEEELGFVLPSKPNPWDCLGTQGHLKWTHSCLECMKVECLANSLGPASGLTQQKKALHHQPLFYHMYCCECGASWRHNEDQPGPWDAYNLMETWT